jgi:DnaK suppressor protein
MDDKRAKELLTADRERVEAELAKVRSEGRAGSDEEKPAGDFNNEGLYEDEMAAGREQELQRRLEAIERAEERLAAGTYGRSIRSGDPIPDGRLEAEPTAELTVEEAHGGAKPA